MTTQDLDPAAEARARDLVARESGCCSFFFFTFAPASHPGGTLLRLEVRVPPAYAGVLDALTCRASAGMRR